MVQINLIPASYLEEALKERLLVLINFALAIVFIVIGGVTLVLAGHRRTLERQVARLEIETKEYEVIARELDDLEAKKKATEAKIAVVQKLLEERFFYPKLMEDIAQSLPKGIWFASVFSRNAAESLDVQIQASSINIDDIISWIRALEQNPKFSNINLGTISNTISATSTQSNFQISFLYKP